MGVVHTTQMMMQSAVNVVLGQQRQQRQEEDARMNDEYEAKRRVYEHYRDDADLPPVQAIVPAPEPVTASVIYRTSDRPDPSCAIGVDYVIGMGRGQSSGWVYKLTMRYEDRGEVRKSQTDVKVMLNQQEAAEYHAFCCRVAERAIREEPGNG